jgi:sugar phosphate isomerase/epimerase
MISPGLLSVTFRQLAVDEIISLAVQADLPAIEWGGDVHVPHGDWARARVVRQKSESAGLTLPTYGSYYRVGHIETGPFEIVLETAVALGTPTIRVWAGRRGSDQADGGYRQRVIEDSRRIVDLASAAGLTVAYEYHGNTLTDTIDSALRLLEAVDRPNLRSFWQPPKGSAQRDNLDAMQRLAPWIEHIHVFSWVLDGDQTVRLPLADHAGQWQAYLAQVAALPDDRYALLEFVRHDDPQQFLADAATLKRWLAALAG